MADVNTLSSALAPLLAHCQALDLSAAAASRASLEAAFPVDGPLWRELKALFVEGRSAGWLCHKEANGVKFSRVQKSLTVPGFSIDAVHMTGPGPGHTHTNGEIDLCFAVSGAPRFDGQPEGYVVYPPGSWHTPTVAGGAMDILYLLPGGAIVFDG
jgi:hypothetical protein